jgi:ubiquinone biosynthesis protein
MKTVSPNKVIRFIGESQIRYNYQNKAKFGKWIKTELSSMGPAFIKLGQFLSTRRDLFTKEVINELSLLQDDIVPTPFEDIVKILETSSNISVDNIFSKLEEKPLASASIGQVHIGYLRSNNKKVAVKIQKPDVALSIRQDLETLRKITRLFKYVASKQTLEAERLLDQYEKYLEAELDYEKEVEYMLRFKKLLEEQPVIIPGVYAKLSSRQVLVMEYVESIKITDITMLRKKGFNTKNIARNLVECFIYQMTKMNYIHCDPHPGNIGVTLDGLKLVLYDYGNIVCLNKNFKSTLSQLIFSIYQKDINEFVELLVRLDVIEVSNEEDIYEIKEFFVYFFNYLETLDSQVLKQSLISGDLTGNFKDNLKINPDYMSLFRVFSLLDGTCSTLDSNFNYIEVLQPISEEMMNDMEFINSRVQKDIDKLRGYPKQIQTTDRNIAKMQKKITTVNEKLQQTQILATLLCVFHNNLELLPIACGITATIYYYMDLDKQPPSSK